MPDPLLEVRLRAQRYWYRDGLSEMVVGIVSLLQGGWILFNHLVNSKSFWYWPGALICLLLIAVIPVARITAAIRERFTYPRSGYVDDGESVRKRRIRVGMALGILVIVVGSLALRYAGLRAWDPDRWIQWLPAVGGLTLGAVSVYVWVRQGLPRFLVLGVLSIVLGVAVSNEYPLKLAMAIWLAGNGCAWLCSGGLTLWNYVRTTPPSADAT
jgi:uncharacterized membrane protein HdeD (DUF308 family)